MANTLSNIISAINNAANANLLSVTLYTSNFCIRFLDVLKNGGYIRDYKYNISNTSTSNRGVQVTILLKYTDLGHAILELKRISSPGKRIYWSSEKIKTRSNGLGNYILSTSRGILYDTEAKLIGVGGEILCSIR